MISLASVCYGDSRVGKYFFIPKHCSISDRSEQNSSKLQHTVCNIFRSHSALKGQGTRDLNPEVVADGWGTFCFKCPFLNLPLLVVFRTFFKLLTSNTKCTLRMNPSTCSRSLKKVHLFLQSLVECHFYFVYVSNFRILDLFFSSSSAVLCKLELTVHVTVFP